MLANKLAGSGVATKLYAEDVFSAHTYTGNGSTQSINNGIDLSTNGGMVWSKLRGGSQNHALIDTTRGNTKMLFNGASGTNAESTVTDAITAFNTTGYTLGTDGTQAVCNANGSSYVGWTFRKAPKFFDVVTWTGNGTAGRTIAHNLGVAPGVIIVKCTSQASQWPVQHRSLAASQVLYLNQTAASGSANDFNSTAATSAVFSVGGTLQTNSNGDTYVAYLFAHDASADGLIQCGSIALDGSGKGTATLGWEAQYILTKNTSATEDWRVFDASRGFTVAGQVDAALYPNLSSEEYAGNSQVYPTATGFGIDALGPSNTYVYLAIRRPNKPPTVGTQVYNAALNNPLTGAGFQPDLFIACNTVGGVNNSKFSDRLRGPLAQLTSSTTAVEGNFFGAAALFSTSMVGVSSSGKISGSTDVEWFFKRAPGVFDVVCYTGTGTLQNVVHNLGTIPELIIIRSRSTANNWIVRVGTSTTFLRLNTNDATMTENASVWVTAQTATTFPVVSTASVNASAVTYSALLFATKTGISKVGSYTGNGGSLTLDMGFTTGARFFMCKRTDSTGDWFVFDTVRGVIAGNDPHLTLNTTAAEVTTDDSVDPDTSGLIVNQVAATNINVTSATYIYLAFA